MAVANKPAQQGAANKQGRNANNNAKPAAKYAVVDDMEIPRRTGGGLKGSKYFDDELAETLENLKVKQGIKLDLIADEVAEGEAGYVTPKRQRYATNYRIQEWIKANAEDGKPVPKYTVAVIEGKDGEKGCLAVRRDA